MKANIPGYFCHRTLLPVVTNLANVCIKFYYAGAQELLDQSKHRCRHTFYGDKSKPMIEVACFKNHLFKYEKTDYTGYSIRNYELVKDLPEWWNIVGKNGERFIRRPERAKLSSLELVILMLNKNT